MPRWTLTAKTEYDILLDKELLIITVISMEGERSCVIHSPIGTEVTLGELGTKLIQLGEIVRRTENEVPSKKS